MHHGYRRRKREICKGVGGWRDLEGLGTRPQEMFALEARQNRRKEVMVKDTRHFMVEKRAPCKAP